MVSRVKGTQDFLDLTLFNFLVDCFKKHIELYNFHEISTPIIEHAELFKRSLGINTDVVLKEMFTITSKSDEEICLRPEATAAIVRAFIENSIQHTPWKVFTYGPMFRYERPQKGRFRQFHQINLEIIGAESGSQDVQFITMLDRFFHEILHLNNYALQINFLGCSDDRRSYKKIIKNFLENSEIINNLCDTCLVRKDHNVLRIFDCKNQQCQTLYSNAPHATDSLCTLCTQEWKQIQEQLCMMSVSFVYTHTLVRGLDYYTKIVFEFVSQDLGAQNTFCGGGRYDHLVKELGCKKDYTSLGAAIGIERLLLIMETVKNKLLLSKKPDLCVILPIEKKQQFIAVMLADNLRAHELVAEPLLENDSLKSMMRQADKLGAKYCLIIGDTEQQNNTVVVKNMITGEEKIIPQSEVINYLKH